MTHQRFMNTSIRDCKYDDCEDQRRKYIQIVIDFL